MYRYEMSADMDLAVVGMWCRMQRDGDLDRIFLKDSQTVSEMFRLIQGANKGMLFEATAEDGIWLAMWFEQVMGVAYAGLWVAKPYRPTLRGLRAVITIYEQALRWFPAILGVTKQEALLEPHRRLGYEILGEIPGIWDGERAWLVMLTREGFARANARRLARFSPAHRPVHWVSTATLLQGGVGGING